MVTQNGIKYALHIISSHFGDRVSKVCECLLREGTLTFQGIKECTQLNSEQAKYSLLVLIQHNCVQPFSEFPGGSGDGPSVTKYMVVFNNILHRTRFPKILGIVAQELDKECRELFEGFLQHGRLTVKQIIERARSMENEENSVEDAIRETLSKLMVARFVERCPGTVPVLEPLVEQHAEHRGPNSVKIAKESESAERRILAAATPVETLRFSLDENDLSTSIIGEKRKHVALELDVEVGVVSEQKAILRPNFEEFTRHLRHKACVENVRTRLDYRAATVLSAILEATASRERKLKTEKTAPLTLDVILGEVVKSEEGHGMNYDHVRVSLEQMGCSHTGESNESYSIDLKNIIELAQTQEVESIVLKRYGREAYRMFRLLSKADRLLETNKIAETTLVDKEEATKTLYKLWKDEYLQMEKVVVSGPRQIHLLLWKINKPILWEIFLDEMYKAALNLNLRVAQELEQEKEILSLPKDKRVGELEKKYHRLVKVSMLLESSLLKLDDAIMLLNDF